MRRGALSLRIQLLHLDQACVKHLISNLADCHSSPFNVLILSAEDGAQDTIIPRLEALGANLDNIHIICAVPIENGKERSFDLTLDVEKLQKSSERISNVKLIIVDPISAYLGKTDSHRNSDVRSALTPVSDFAEASGACLHCVTHLNKGGQGTRSFCKI